MKSKFVLVSLMIASFMLAGCSAKSMECSNISAETETVTDQDELPIDISKIEQIFVDEYKDRDGNLQCVQHIVDRLADYGFIAIDSDNKVDMVNAEKMRQFITAWESGEHTEALVFQVFNNGGLNLLEIVADEGNVRVERTYFTFQDDHLSKTVHSEFEADHCEYTNEGYLIIGGSWHSPELYVLTMSEEEEHIALRVEPLDEQCRELNEKYMAPVSYKLNNMFIIDWDEDDLTSLDFYDVFERFYEETYGKNCPYTMSDDLSEGNEYEIPADEFENVIMQHIKVSSEELHTLLRYDTDKNIYIYRPRGFDEFDYAEVPYPEVAAYKTNDDGSLTLTVNAVFPNDNTSKLFSHKVTVSDENGKIYYLSNEIPGYEELDLWWHAERLSDDEWNDHYKDSVYAEDDYSWMIPQADHEIFTEEEKKQIEADTLRNAAEAWEYTKQLGISVWEALGELGVIATADDENTQNGEKFIPFYDDYLNGKSGMVTIYKVYDDGLIGSSTFLYRDEEIQSYYVGVKPGADGQSCVSGKSVQEIASVKYTPKGYFIYEYKNPMLHASSYGYFRLSPLSDECRSLTERFLKYLDFQKYKLMVCDWDEETVHELLMPGMFEDFYYIKYGEAYRDSFASIPADLFEEVMTTYLPVTVPDLRKAYEYDEIAGTYSQETVYNSPYPPFLEVTDYKYNVDGTITLYADGVWPDYNSDHAFTNEIVIKPFKDGTFRILSNDVTEQELKLPPVAYTK
ncbi:MAG: DUF6070 family protein [Lachnospiraceae bacterium]|nr:DUF6070 family protein [Lachnospiraceae bacterium]